MQQNDSSEISGVIERQKKISELQYAKFGALHEFHTSRTANFLNELVVRKQSRKWKRHITKV